MAPGSARGRMRRLPRVKHHLQGSVTAEPSSDVFIGVDLGTSGVRALATDGLGRRLSMTHRSVPVLAPSRDAAEQEPRAWWEASCAALRELVGSGACFGRRIRGIALAGQMHGLVLLDRDGEPVRPAIIWLDNRSRNELRSWRERLGEGAVEGITGIPLSPGMLGPSLSWVARNEPSNYARAAVALLPKDYLGLRLTGVACTDPTDATGTLLFDAAARRWSNRIVQAVGLREALLPEVVETFAERDRVTPEAAEATGLPIGLPVICGGGDTALAALALDLAPGRVSDRGQHWRHRVHRLQQRPYAPGRGAAHAVLRAAGSMAPDAAHPRGWGGADLARQGLLRHAGTARGRHQHAPRGGRDRSAGVRRPALPTDAER